MRDCRAGCRQGDISLPPPVFDRSCMAALSKSYGYKNLLFFSIIIHVHAPLSSDSPDFNKIMRIAYLARISPLVFGGIRPLRRNSSGGSAVAGKNFMQPFVYILDNGCILRSCTNRAGLMRKFRGDTVYPRPLSSTNRSKRFKNEMRYSVVILGFGSSN